MSSPVKLLEYESLKIVLLHMEANMRLQLSQRLPSLLLIEKAVPLKIRYLKFEKNRTTVNQTVYTLGISREYPPDQVVPALIQKQNAEGGICIDLDEFGFSETNEELTLGDVDVRRPQLAAINEFNEPPENYEERRIRAEKRLRIYEKALTRRLESDKMEEREVVQIVVQSLLDTVSGSAHQFYQFQLPNYKVPPIPHVWNRQHPDYFQWLLEVQEEILDAEEIEVCTVSSYPISRIRALRDRAEYEWLPFFYCEKNQKPPYSYAIQLTIQNKQEIKIQKYDYNMKYKEAMKKLNTVILKGRTVLMRKLVVHRKITILRLPENRKVKVKELKINVDALNRFWATLDPSSYPLNVLSLTQAVVGQAAVISQSRIIRESQRLIIHNHNFSQQSWINILRDLPNRSVELKYQGRTFHKEDFTGLVRNWLGAGRPVGSNFSFGISKQTTARKVMILVEMLPEARRVCEHKINIPMNNGSQLIVSCTQVSGDVTPLLFLNRDYSTRWILKMKVVEG